MRSQRVRRGLATNSNSKSLTHSQGVDKPYKADFAPWRGTGQPQTPCFYSEMRVNYGV